MTINTRARLWRRIAVLPMTAVVVFAGTSACSGDAESGTVEAKGDFGDLTRVADDRPAGIDVSSALLEKSPVAVVSAGNDAAQAVAGSAAVALRSPMLVADVDGSDGLETELKRLGVTSILRVGDADVPDGDWKVTDAAAGAVALGAQIGAEFSAEKPVPADEIDDELADSEPESPTYVTLAGAEPVPGPEEGSGETFSRLSPKESGAEPTALAADGTSVAGVVTGRASGLDFVHIPGADPRVDAESVDAVTRASSILTLGNGWGTDEQIAKQIEQAKTEEQLPGGGQLIFPGHRFVAAYGAPGIPALGILGEQDPAASVGRVEELADEYRPFSRQTVIPTFEIIGSVASADPGPDGAYSSLTSPEQLEASVDAITKAGGYALIDLQPGRANFLDQAKAYADLLKRPGVGLALDPEWRLEPGALPAQEVGHVSVDEVNAVGEWLADLTADAGLPQKMFVIHQFQQQMIRERERLDTSRPEIATVIHADGHGTPEDKEKTWEVMKQDLPAGVNLAWKNFYDEDTPMYTPEQSMAQQPKPWLVTYQ
ncbi:hypothetical protein [Dietzia sp.]|uniref:hypothetical protein n=1 Tax=Dietzia sp. TaxID=1871616 RepID=UPI002FD91D50